VPDPVFAAPRLAEIYDVVEGERKDLDHYLAIAADEEWDATLRGVHAALRPGGQLVFEARDPARETWQGWNREATYVSYEIPGVGMVETWWDLTEVSGEYVSYRRTYVFAADGTTLTSDSTRRFRSRTTLEGSLRSAGYTLTEVRGAPDRPGRELVFVAGKPLPTRPGQQSRAGPAGSRS
jgi:hypothetical protein